MDSNSILYPGIAMFFLTLILMLRMAFERYRAIKNRSVSIKYYRTYNEGEQPEHLHLIARHVQNHFEIPPLFYAGILFTYVTGTVTMISVIFAWLFFLTRCVHTYIHLGSNDVSVRFITFGISLAFLAGLWATLLISLLRAPA